MTDIILPAIVGPYTRRGKTITGDPRFRIYSKGGKVIAQYSMGGRVCTQAVARRSGGIWHEYLRALLRRVEKGVRALSNSEECMTDTGLNVLFDAYTERGKVITDDPNFRFERRGHKVTAIFSINGRERLQEVAWSTGESTEEHLRRLLCSVLNAVATLTKANDVKDTNPKDGAATTRLDLSLFPDTARAFGALAFTEGDLKYGGYNFREKGAKASVYYAALARHMAKWYNGEEVDPRTRVPHLANALACIAVLIDCTVAGNLVDDRPPAVDVSALLAEFEGKVAHLQQTFPRAAARVTGKEK